MAYAENETPEPPPPLRFGRRQDVWWRGLGRRQDVEYLRFDRKDVQDHLWSDPRLLQGNDVQKSQRRLRQRDDVGDGIERWHGGLAHDRVYLISMPMFQRRRAA